jgi:hypothetical protein
MRLVVIKTPHPVHLNPNRDVFRGYKLFLVHILSHILLLFNPFITVSVLTPNSCASACILISVNRPLAYVLLYLGCTAVIVVFRVLCFMRPFRIITGIPLFTVCNAIAMDIFTYAKGTF